jgi:voltage-gated potassium channel
MRGLRRRLFPLEELSRVARQFWTALFLLLFVILVAAAYYIVIEGRATGEYWSAVDGLYMAVLTVTTVGFMEVHPLSQHGRIFTIALAITGIGLLAYAVRSAATLLVGQQLSAEVQYRRRLRALRQVQDHFIVCGYGRMGSEAVQQLRRRGLEVVVIEQDPDAVEDYREPGVLYVIGNATHDEHLRNAGVERARCLVAAIGPDEDNLFLVLSARLLNPAMHIVARAGQEAMVDKLKRAGASRVLSPYILGGRRLAAAATDPGVMDFLEMVLHGDVDVEIAAVAVPDGSPVLGEPLLGGGVFREGGAMILAVMSAKGEFHTNPRPHTVLAPGDTLIAMGPRAQLQGLKHLVAG